MNYWDSTALIPLFIEEARSETYFKKIKQDSNILTAWHAVPECASAFCRLNRESILTNQQLNRLLGQLEETSKSWYIVSSGKRLETLTLRALKLHSLRAMDAIHLAAACLFRTDETSGLSFYTEDTRLISAAAKEGFGNG